MALTEGRHFGRPQIETAPVFLMLRPRITRRERQAMEAVASQVFSVCVQLSSGCLRKLPDESSV